MGRVTETVLLSLGITIILGIGLIAVGWASVWSLIAVVALGQLAAQVIVRQILHQRTDRVGRHDGPGH